MSKYTTGEIAKLCDVSVRTVQYYDSRNLLVPSELSEGGRRLYNEDDLRKMRIICFLRQTGLPINSICALFAEENPEEIISVLLEEQDRVLREELRERQKQLEMIETIHREKRELENFSVESIGDIAHLMKNKNKLKNLRTGLALVGLPLTALCWAGIILWTTAGFWWLAAVSAALMIPFAIVASICYFKRVAYICPHCHEIIYPSLKEAFFAYHTPKMRRLNCPACTRRGMCIEIYAEKEIANHV